jgi:CHAD domain-containing protein
MNSFPSSDAEPLENGGLETEADWIAKTLCRRFRDIAESFKPAALCADENPEDVHQLRVACRRAAAALVFFKHWLPRRRRSALVRLLQRVRKSAGEARDIDVMLCRIANADIPLKPKQKRRMIRFLSRRRKQAQKPLARIYQRLSETKCLDESFQAIVARIAPRGCESQCDLLLRRNAAIRKYLKRLEADPTSIDELHRLRIDGKQLRYTLELFRHRESDRCIKSVLKRSRKIQDRLGEIVDHLAAEHRLRAWKKKTSRRRIQKTLRQMAAFERQMANRKTAELHEWWKGFATEELQAQLRTLVAD